jgi:hypothetical protein
MSKSMKVYHTLFNGQEPFKVEMKPSTKQIKVFKLTRTEYDEKTYEVISNEYNKKIVDTKYSNVYMGKSPKNKMTKFTKGYGSKFDGNSFLVELHPPTSNTYLYIGKGVYSFKVDDDERVLTYQSPIGNNLVPYPYMITNKRVYFLMEQKTLDINDFPKPEIIKATMKEDLYEYLYNPELKLKAKKMKKVKIISKQPTI